MAQALYRKWRPGTWAEVVGQDPIIQTIRNAVTSGRIGHAYLFSGPRGTGKTTTARLLAKALNCTGEGSEKPCDRCANCQAVRQGSFLDLIEIDAATNTGVDDVRDLKEKINFAPNTGRYKVYIIDEVHMFTQNAFNALLKTLEEPPPHAIFILATTDLHKVPATILSRCQRFEFRRIPVATIVDHLAKKAREEGIQVEAEALTLIARQATGSLRDAISLLDQLASLTPPITLAVALEVLGTTSPAVVTEMVDAMAGRDTSRAVDLLQSALDGGAEARQLSRQMVDHLRGMLLSKSGNSALLEVAPETRESLARQAAGWTVRQLLDALERFRMLSADSRSASWLPGLGFELALVETIAGLSSPGQLDAIPSLTGKTPEGIPKSIPPTHRMDEPAQAVVQPASAPSEPAAAGEGQAQKPVGVPGLADIQSNWKKIAETVRKYNPATQALVNSCKPVDLKEKCLHLSFASLALKQKMESSDHLVNTRQAIQTVTGADLDIRCVVAQPQGLSAKTAGSDPDGMVSTALRELGGQVVEVKQLDEKQSSAGDQNGKRI